jgi:hypothetical protein
MATNMQMNWWNRNEQARSGGVQRGKMPWKSRRYARAISSHFGRRIRHTIDAHVAEIDGNHKSTPRDQYKSFSGLEFHQTIHIEGSKLWSRQPSWHKQRVKLVVQCFSFCGLVLSAVMTTFFEGIK